MLAFCGSRGTLRVMAETWAQYVRRATEGTTQVQLALVTGVAQTAIGRWLRGAEFVKAFESTGC